MKLTEFAIQNGKFVTIICPRPNRWAASIDGIGYPVGWVTHVAFGETPEKALEALTAAFNCEKLVVDGNTDKKREIGPTKLEAA